MEEQTMKKLLAVLLVLGMLLGLAACGNPTTAPETPETPAVQPEPPAEPEAPVQPETPEEPAVVLSPEEQILADRRAAVVAYMRALSSTLWEVDETLVYTLTSNVTPEQASSGKILTLKAGQIYQGVPYSYAAGSEACWLEMLSEPNADGVRKVQGVTWQALSGTGTYARLGADCSSAVERSWQSIGADIPAKSTNAMTPDNGFLRVGEYESPNDTFEDTVKVAIANGKDKMFAAYALLQPGDAVVCRTSTGHAMMVVGVDIVLRDDGTINGLKSTVTVVEQTGGSRTIRNEATGKLVNTFFRIDQPYTFNDLLKEGYLPITCRELIDPAPMEEAKVTDSNTAPSAANLFEGVLQSTHGMDAVTVTVSAGGSEVQKCIARPVRANVYSFNMDQFLSDGPEKLSGSVDLTKLSAGSYRCTVTARTVSGQTFTVREFDFTV